MAGTWQLLTPTSSGTHKLTSAGDTIDSGTITAKDNLKVIVYVQDSGSNVAPRFRLNGQSGDHYYARRNENGSTSDDVYNSSPNIDAWKWYQTGSGTDVARYYVFTIKNTKGKHKLAIGTVVESTTTGDGDVLRKTEFVGRWNGQNDTSITSIQVVNTGSNDFGVGSYIAVWGASDDIVTDEKTTLTNVPDNTRYEETDTRKIYRRVLGSTTTQANSNDSGSTSLGGGGGNVTEIGAKIFSGHALVGKKLETVIFKQSKYGSPTGNGQVKVYDSSFNTIATSGDSSIAWSALPNQGSGVGDEVSYTFSTPPKILANYTIAVLGGSLNGGEVNVIASNADDFSYMAYTFKNSGTWRVYDNSGSYSHRSPYFKFTTASEWIERNTE